MVKRYKIFWTNYHEIKNAKKEIAKSPNKDLVRRLLYSSFKLIGNGKYQLADLELRERADAEIVTRKEDDLINKTLNAYLKAYHATIPVNMPKGTLKGRIEKGALKDMETDRKALSELVESFNKYGENGKSI